MMKQFFTKTALLAALLLLGLNAGAALGTVSAQTSDASKSAVCEGVGLTGGNCGTTDEAGAGVTGTIRLAINTLTLIVGVVAVIMIIIGGLKYVTSSGDSNNISSAKNTILFAIVGLVIVALAQLIVRFTLNNTGKATTTSCPAGQSVQPGGGCQ